MHFVFLMSQNTELTAVCRILTEPMTHCLTCRLGRLSFLHIAIYNITLWEMWWEQGAGGRKPGEGEICFQIMRSKGQVERNRIYVWYESEASRMMKMQGVRGSRGEWGWCLSYPGSAIQGHGECTRELKTRAQDRVEWMETSVGLICDRRIAEKLIEKIYKAVVRLVQFRDSVSVKNGRGMELVVRSRRRKGRLSS